MSDSATNQSAAAPERTLGKAYDVRLMTRLWQFVRPHWKLLLLSFTLIPLTLAFELYQPLLIKRAIEDHIAISELSGLGTIAVVYMVLVACQSLTSYAQLYTLQLVGQRSMHDLRVAIYKHVTRQRAAFFDRMPIGRLLTRMTNDVENINEMFASGVVTLVADLLKLLAIIIMMFSLDVQLTLMTFICFPILVLVVEYARRLMRASFREIRIKVAALNSYAQEHLSGLRVVQLFARERQALAEYDQISADHRDAYFQAIRADATMYAMVEGLGVISIAAIVWYAGGYMVADAATVAMVVAFIEYIRKFFIPIRDFSAKYTVMQSAMAASERIVGLLDNVEPDAPLMSEEEVAEHIARSPAPDRAGDDAPAERPTETDDATDATDATDAADAADARHAVGFADVHFSYRPGEPILRGISFTIESGQTVAVVGATGSGKSTLIKLLARLYEIECGQIFIAGEDIRTIPVDQLRRRITVVTQDVFLFAGTVADNVRLGAPDADDDQVRAALQRVGAYEVLARRSGERRDIDDPLELPVSQRASNFSAGERQLISFARALVREPELLILDEATAHVDPEAESAIERGVDELMRDRTTLVIAHRLSTIRNADLILVMQRGRIVEQGTHDELVARGGAYARLERTFSRKD